MSSYVQVILRVRTLEMGHSCIQRIYCQKGDSVVRSYDAVRPWATQDDLAPSCWKPSIINSVQWDISRSGCCSGPRNITRDWCSNRMLINLLLLFCHLCREIRIARFVFHSHSFDHSQSAQLNAIAKHSSIVYACLAQRCKSAYPGNIFAARRSKSF